MIRSLDGITVFKGNVGINVEHPECELTVDGDVCYTGKLYKRSNFRTKHDFEQVDEQEQLENIKRLNVYNCRYKEEYDRKRRSERGVIAQQVQQVMPHAVKQIDVECANIEDGMLLAVNRDALQIEVIDATKAVAGRIDEIEERIEELENKPKFVTLFYVQFFQIFSQFFSSPQKVFNIVNYSRYVRNGCRAAPNSRSHDHGLGPCQ
jgi:hypothetical protein